MTVRLTVTLALLLTLVLQAEQAAAAGFRYHTVADGQNLARIAKRYRVSVRSLIVANRLEKPSKLKPGQRLVVPMKGDKTGQATRDALDEAAKPKKTDQPQSGKAKPEADKPADKAEPSEPAKSKPPPPKAPKVGDPTLYRVRAGQNLGLIAKRHHVTVKSIIVANALTSPRKIMPGTWLVIPGKHDDGTHAAKKRAALIASTRKSDRREAAPAAASKTSPQKSKPAAREPSVHVVGKGENLGRIARRHKVSVRAMIIANQLRNPRAIRPGQLLVVPSPDDSGLRAAKRRRAILAAHRARSERSTGRRSKKLPGSSSWRRYARRARRGGYVQLIGYKSRFKGYIMGPGNKVLRGARHRIAKVMGGKPGKHHPHQRLLKLIAIVSDTFGGRPIRVVSGFRNRSYASKSKHRSGRALDFSIPGVPNSALRDYLVTFRNVGVGYYPNSSFVHFDVRPRKTYWVDQSGPGQRPRYTTIKTLP